MKSLTFGQGLNFKRRQTQQQQQVEITSLIQMAREVWHHLQFTVT